MSIDLHVIGLVEHEAEEASAILQVVFQRLQRVQPMGAPLKFSTSLISVRSQTFKVAGNASTLPPKCRLQKSTLKSIARANASLAPTVKPNSGFFPWISASPSLEMRENFTVQC